MSKLQKWIALVTKEEDKSITISVNEHDMRDWRVVFKADFFKQERYEVLLDNDSWVPVFENMTAELEQMKKSNSLEYGPVVVNGVPYMLKQLDKDCIIQENLDTNTVRMIRKSHGSLHNDMQTWFDKYGNGRTSGVHVQLTFSDEFPNLPPFARVVCPRFNFQTGHITSGGSFCSKLLHITHDSDGWNSNMNPISLLRQLRNNIIEGSGSIDLFCKFDYTAKEAREAYDRTPYNHPEWQVKRKKQ